MKTFAEVRTAVTTGNHTAWRKAVRILLDRQTPQIRLKIEEAHLIVSHWDAHHRWFTSIEPHPLGMEKPYEKIASYHKESSDGVGEPQVTMFPVGLVFIGKNRIGQWGDEIALVNTEILSAVLDRPHDVVAHELEGLAYTYASLRIRQLGGVCEGSVDVVTDLDGYEMDVIPDLIHIAKTAASCTSN